MTGQQLADLCTLWQRVLRLQDWNLTLEVVDFLDVFGQTQYDKYKNAHIKICSEHTLNPNQITSCDQEVTVVHELLHLHFRPLDRVVQCGSHEDDAVEELIETLAQAFVALRRTSLPKAAAPKRKK